jgi:uncharacterized repeat protein (TIGR01451 family)
MSRVKNRELLLLAIRVIGLLAGVGFLVSQLLLTSPKDIPDVLSQSEIPTPTPPPIPQLALAKTINNSVPETGDVVTYTLSYSASNASASNARLYDFLPAGVQLLSTNPVYTSYSNGVLTFEDALVGPTVENVTIRVQVLGGYEQIYNYAVLTADYAAVVHTSLLTNITQPSAPLPSTLRVTKAGYSYVLSGGELVYTLRCENVGDSTVDNVQVVDVLPTNTVLVNTSPTADSVTPPIVQWSVGSLSPGQAWQSIITVTAPSYTGIITNTALTDSPSTVMTQTLFATGVVTDAGILQVSKAAHPEEVFVDDEIVYTITYWNSGSRVATGVTLTDTFPADIVVTGYSPAPTSITPERGVWELGSLDPGESGQITITVTVIGEANRYLYNTVDITGDALTFPGHTELLTPVRYRLILLPLILRNY